ncbi:tetrapyrrole methylase family protein / MazG family protein [Malonomonas rubra DSM 5091]|uniref:Tetrapyrrole methylase family protein / MazG family protein n=1 Tax=Malonomonas rubra DSM 5091 TaxID=1122189 RepID=A0A1M6DEK6_MALRU|nr:MazG family protein [Malonomonas rubra]SHI71610.1 tetrapyrrole methylase family protein / MazG family protein [Malonomonas rubra DSM 5091]
MNRNEQLNKIHELLDIMTQLRAEDGCPWDREQTPSSLKKHILEESYELLEALDRGDADEICDELGDLLLQVVFQAQIFSESGTFDMGDVAASISSKLKRRHPHIFGDAEHAGHEERWERIKLQERNERGQSNTLAQRIPSALPALKRATKFAKKKGPEPHYESLQQIENQLKVLRHNLSENNKTTADIEQAISLLLQNTCELCAATGSDPEELLRQKTTQLIASYDSKNQFT